MGIPGFITYFIFIAAFTIAFLLIGLILWHGHMISHGVTPLERDLNREYTRQCYEQGFVFVNPYDFGLIENWKRFFGVRTIGGFVRRVLWPSMHKPEGDGITWDGFNVNRNLQTHHRVDQGQSTRPIAFPPGVQPNFPHTYRSPHYRAVIPPWEQQQTRPVYSSPGYQPPTEPIELRKDR